MSEGANVCMGVRGRVWVFALFMVPLCWNSGPKRF